MDGGYVHGGGYLLPTESTELSLFACAAAAATVVVLLFFICSCSSAVYRGVIGLCIVLCTVLDCTGGGHEHAKVVYEGSKPYSMLLLRAVSSMEVKLTGEHYEHVNLVL